MQQTLKETISKLTLSAQNEIKRAARQLIRNDKTQWNLLQEDEHCAHAASFFKKQPWHIRSLLEIKNLQENAACNMQKGPEFPFVFGDLMTNGLETAMVLALANASAMFFRNGEPMDVCMAVAPSNTKIHVLLEISHSLAVGEISGFNASPPYTSYVKLAGMARAIQIVNISDLLLKLARCAYMDNMLANPCGLSCSLREDIFQECLHGRGQENASKLLSKKLELEIEQQAAMCRASICEDQNLDELMSRALNAVSMSVHGY